MPSATAALAGSGARGATVRRVALLVAAAAALRALRALLRLWRRRHRAAAEGPPLKGLSTPPSDSLSPGGSFSSAATDADGDGALRRVADHALTPWLVENGAVWGVAAAAQAVPKPRRGEFVRGFALSFLSGLVLVEALMAVQMWVNDVLYAHVPYFSRPEKRPPSSLRVAFSDWARCNLNVHLIGAVYKTIGLQTITDQQYADFCSSAVRPSFFGKLAVHRFIVDIFFYLGHRALHHPTLFWIHKRHHDHYTPTIMTNVHFTAADLFVEAFLPNIASLVALTAAGVRLTGMEAMLLFGYMTWFEMGSHSGKPLPTISIYPPLAPLYNRLLGDVDRRNIEFHESHHNKLMCNYGITQWIDHLMGTREFSGNKVVSAATRPAPVRAGNKVVSAATRPAPVGAEARR